jgi:hypothetical protein
VVGDRSSIATALVAPEEKTDSLRMEAFAVG